MVLLAAAARADDLTIRQRTTTSAGGRADTRQETQYVHGDLLVIDGADTRTIVDLDAKTMTVAEKEKKTYFVLTFDQMRAQAEAVQRQMDDMPPDVRKMMQEMLGPGGAVTLTPTGKRETIAGYPASEYQLAGGPFRGAIWTTESIALPGGVRKWRELSASATAQAGPARPLAQALVNVKGVPLRTSMTAAIGPATFATASEVLEVSMKPPPRDVLAVPPGFTRVAPPRLVE